MRDSLSRQVWVSICSGGASSEANGFCGVELPGARWNCAGTCAPDSGGLRIPIKLRRARRTCRSMPATSSIIGVASCSRLIGLACGSARMAMPLRAGTLAPAAVVATLSLIGAAPKNPCTAGFHHAGTSPLWIRPTKQAHLSPFRIPPMAPPATSKFLSSFQAGIDQSYTFNAIAKPVRTKMSKNPEREQLENYAGRETRAS